MSHLLDVVPEAQKAKEPDDQEFGSYCFKELEPVKVMETVSIEVIELTDCSEVSKYSQKLRNPVEKHSVMKNVDVDEEKMQDANREFQEHSQNSLMDKGIEVSEIKFEEKPVEKCSLLSGSEF